MQEAHLVGDIAREPHLMGGDHHGHASGGEFADHVEDLGDQHGVERARDLVEQHDVGLHRQRAHDRDALLLSAREPVRVLLGLVVRARTA